VNSYLDYQFFGSRHGLFEHGCVLGCCATQSSAHPDNAYIGLSSSETSVSCYYMTRCNIPDLKYHIGQHSPSPGRNLNHGPPEYEVEEPLDLDVSCVNKTKCVKADVA
jgi:hypothetical protein